MAVLLNGVLALRDASSLMPSIISNKVKIQDCTINSLKVDSGHIATKKIINDGTTTEEILPNPNNLPLVLSQTDWNLETELFAAFNGDLEGGPLSFYGNEVDSIIVRRTSNRSNYRHWEDVKLIENIQEVKDYNHNFQLEDKIIESGIWYRYGIQPISNEKRGSLYQGQSMAMIYEDIFLVGEGGKQLKIRFNPNISSFRRNIREARIETIGSAYPFITKNGNVDYKEFPLGGTITHFMDKTQDFAPRSEMFIEDEFKENSFDLSGDYEALYRGYGLNDYNNTVLEREFRNKVMNFLQDGKPKLFKSPTEGLMLVRLMDVNLTPNLALGRLIYDFTCTAIEVGKIDLKTMEGYRIQER